MTAAVSQSDFSFEAFGELPDDDANEGAQIHFDFDHVMVLSSSFSCTVISSLDDHFFQVFILSCLKKKIYACTLPETRGSSFTSFLLSCNTI